MVSLHICSGVLVFRLFVPTCTIITSLLLFPALCAVWLIFIPRVYFISISRCSLESFDASQFRVTSDQNFYFFTFSVLLSLSGCDGPCLAFLLRFSFALPATGLLISAVPDSLFSFCSLVLFEASRDKGLLSDAIVFYTGVSYDFRLC